MKIKAIILGGGVTECAAARELTKRDLMLPFMLYK